MRPKTEDDAKIRLFRGDKPHKPKNGGHHKHLKFSFTSTGSLLRNAPLSSSDGEAKEADRSQMGEKEV